MMCLLRPALKCGNCEESEHASQHIVKVEVTVEPFSFRQHSVLQGILYVLPEESPEKRERSLENSPLV